jgi:hypothetical protein
MRRAASHSLMTQEPSPFQHPSLQHLPSVVRPNSAEEPVLPLSLPLRWLVERSHGSISDLHGLEREGERGEGRGRGGEG